MRNQVASLLAYCLLVIVVVDYITFAGLSVTRSFQATDTAPTSGIRTAYIASTHWNNEGILRSHWNAAVVALVKKLGNENVYVSVYESGSWDNSKDALRDLDRQLGELNVGRTIVIDDTTHSDEIRKTPTKNGWVDTPRGKKEPRRIPYLSRLRNKSLEPLEKLVAAGKTFDRIIFLNDVIFSVSTLISIAAMPNNATHPG
jgi:hypothetical protein